MKGGGRRRANVVGCENLEVGGGVGDDVALVGVGGLLVVEPVQPDAQLPVVLERLAEELPIGAPRCDRLEGAVLQHQLCSQTRQGRKEEEGTRMGSWAMRHRSLFRSVSWVE